MPTSAPKPPPISAEKLSPGLMPFQWRYSLRTLFRLTTILAILLGFSAIMPASLSWIVNGTLWLAATGWLVTGLIFARGDRRAFCIGAAIVVSSIWTGVGGRYMQGFHMIYGSRQLLDISPVFSAWLDLLVIAVTAFLNGIFCVFARRYFERNDR